MAGNDFDPPPLETTEEGENLAQLAARLETEIKACLEAGPPPGMSRRVFERVQAAAKVQLLALDEHPDVFHDQGAKELRERMERKVSAEMQEPPLCLLCGQRPPCPHVPLVPKKGANRLAHWVGNQVELQHSYSRLAYTGVRPQHKHGRVLAQVIGLDTVSDMRLRVKVLGGIVVAHDENDPTADAAILAERRKLKHILHGAPLLVPQNPVGTRDPELRATVKQLGIMGMAEPVSKRKIVWHHTLKGTDPEVSERAVVVRPPGERNGALMMHKKAGGKSPKGSTSSRPKTLALPSPERGGSGSSRSLRGGTSRRPTSARSSGTASPTSPVRRASSPKKSASQAALLEKSSSVGAIDAID
uniref:Uncharacterized protein n=1 Tax=Haptolina ericina TaxID=156174 RepID=A0A7S3ATP0_9EUKA